MKLLILASLLAITSFAQTEEYTVGTVDVFLPQTDPSAIDINDGLTVSNSAMDTMFQLKCDSSINCGSNDHSGAYCDNGLCTLCPVGGVDDCGEHAECRSVCEQFLVNAKSCTSNDVNVNCKKDNVQGIDPTGGNGGFFCNLLAGQTQGKCTQCRYVNTDIRGQKNQCFAIPSWASDNTYVTCRAQCELFEISMTQPDMVDGIIPDEAASAIENAFGPNFCDLYATNGGVDVCSRGSSHASSIFVSIFDDYDYEIFGEPECRYRECEGEDADNGRCMLHYMPEGTPCTDTLLDADNNIVYIAGNCSEGECKILPTSECPPGMETTLFEAADCTKSSYSWGQNPQILDAAFTDSGCNVVSLADVCDTQAAQVSQLLCTTKSYLGGDLTRANAYFNPAYFNPQDDASPQYDFQPKGVTWTQSGHCIIGNPSTEYECVIDTPGTYIYRSMKITYYEQAINTDPNGRDEQVTLVYIPLTTRQLTQTAKCPSGKSCNGEIYCESYSNAGNYPCGGSFASCKFTTASPTQDPVASSHGDPIIWTFHDECYDLNKDGKYVATKTPKHDHYVNIGVYNDFMREIEVVNEKGETLLYINVNGEYDADNFPYYFKTEENKCPASMKATECKDKYLTFWFDALDFEFVVHILRHDYNDPALKEGELGYHLDIYPVPFERFHEDGNKENYSGLYFENPLPEELEFCAGGSERAP